jgi:uncharacterized HhH-GPD family protein
LLPGGGYHWLIERLVAVVCDQGILAERAWAIPYLLAQRLGTLDPAQLASRRADVQAAFAEPPKLHRFVNQVSGWIVDAADIVTERYEGDASAIWGKTPTAADLRARFDEFPGIGQKKAAMAVEILERTRHVRLADLSGSDVAYDVHLRRVFLRTGLAEYDDVDHMVAVHGLFTRNVLASWTTRCGTSAEDGAMLATRTVPRVRW